MFNLKEVRTEKGFTQKSLSEASGVGRSLIANIECGLNQPSISTAKKLAKVLEIDWTLFFD